MKPRSRHAKNSLSGRIHIIAHWRGICSLCLLVGLGFALGGSALFASITFASPAGRLLRFIVGGGLILLGLMQAGYLANAVSKVGALSSPFMRQAARWRGRNPALGFAVLGFAYPLAGFG